MIKKNMKWTLVLIASLLFVSCNSEEFGVGKQSSTVQTEALKETDTVKYSSYTLIKPPVDLLFLWDNSSSTNYINDEAKVALNNTVNYISARFDYQAVIAPLVGTGNTGAYFFSSEGATPEGITVIPSGNAQNVISNLLPATGNAESGAKRARDLISTNIDNSVFRKNANTIIIVMSNEDDNTYNSYGGDYDLGSTVRTNYANGISHDLLCLKGDYSGGLHNSYSSYNSSCSNVSPKLDALMLRFLTIAPSTGCQSYFQKNYVYRQMSQTIAFQGNSSELDFTDLCSESYSHIFDNVNNVIEEVIQNHKYDYWPVAGIEADVDPTSIKVYKSNGVQLTSSEYTYVGKKYSQNTRYEPTVGEPYTGHMIQLLDTGKVTYPDYLTVKYNASPAFYGYCQISATPLESSIEVKINGSIIESSNWTLLKTGDSPQYFSSKNIRIKSATDFTEETPALTKSGYFVKLDSSVVLSDDDTCAVSYHSTGQVN